MSPKQFTRLIAVGAVMFSAGATTALPASAATHRAHARSHHRSHHVSAGIPQHNGGDRDPDNNGRPSDGDGNV
jgi:hypothetical protein